MLLQLRAAREQPPLPAAVRTARTAAGPFRRFESARSAAALQVELMH